MLSAWHQRWVRRVTEVTTHFDVVHRWQGWRDPQGDGHVHHIPTIVVAVEGRVALRRGRERVVLEQGNCLLIAPGVWHEHLPLRGSSASWEQGLLTAASDIVYREANGYRWGAVPLQPAKRLIESLWHANSGTQHAALLGELLEANLSVEAVDPAAQHPAVSRMLQAMWSGLHDGVQAADLVAVSGLSRSQAYSLFTAATGSSPHQALLEARTNLAEGLIQAGLTITAAATSAGFANDQALRRRRSLSKKK